MNAFLSQITQLEREMNKQVLVILIALMSLSLFSAIMDQARAAGLPTHLSPSLDQQPGEGCSIPPFPPIPPHPRHPAPPNSVTVPLHTPPLCRLQGGRTFPIPTI